MEDFLSYIKNKKNLGNIIALVILLVGLPVALGLVRQQQILRSRAAGEINFVESTDPDQNNCVRKGSDGRLYSICSKVSIKLTSSLGPPAGSTQSCTTDNDCSDGKKCVSNFCVLVPGNKCDPDDSDALIKSRWTYLPAESKCDAKKPSAKYKCIYKNKKDQEKTKVKNIEGPCPNASPSATPSANLCDPKKWEKNNPANKWDKTKTGECKRGHQTDIYTCTYTENGKTKTINHRDRFKCDLDASPSPSASSSATPITCNPKLTIPRAEGTAKLSALKTLVSSWTEKAGTRRCNKVDKNPSLTNFKVSYLCPKPGTKRKAKKAIVLKAVPGITKCEDFNLKDYFETKIGTSSATQNMEAQDEPDDSDDSTSLFNQIFGNLLSLIPFEINLRGVNEITKNNIVPVTLAQENTCADRGQVSCSKEQADNGYPADNQGTFKDGVCYRKIYKYESNFGEAGNLSYCCSLQDQVAKSPDECGGKKEICSKHQDPSIPSACESCIKSKDTPLLKSIRDTDGDLNSCSDKEVFNFWCNGGIKGAEGCPKQRLELCKDECKDWKVSASPTPKPTDDGDGDRDRDRDRDRGGGRNKTPKPTPTPTPVPQGVTFTYRVAANTEALKTAPDIPYLTEPTIKPDVVLDPGIGDRAVFVQFNGLNPAGQPAVATMSATIKVVVAPPTEADTAVSCQPSLTGSGITVRFKGQNFGSDKGSIKTKGEGNTEFNVADWSDTAISATADLPGNSDHLGKTITLVLTRADGIALEKACTIGAKVGFDLGAKLFCRTNLGRQDTEDVEVAVLENAPGAKPIIIKDATITREGLLTGLEDLNFVKDQKYIISILAPKSVRRNSEAFVTPLEGYTQKLTLRENNKQPNDYNKLPIGNIAPLNDEDDKIDNADKFELIHEFGQSTSQGSLPADFNNDGAVNTHDWACMVHDFPSTGDRLPAQSDFGGTNSDNQSSPSPAPSQAPSESQ